MYARTLVFRANFWTKSIVPMHPVNRFVVWWSSLVVVPDMSLDSVVSDNCNRRNLPISRPYDIWGLSLPLRSWWADEMEPQAFDSSTVCRWVVRRRRRPFRWHFRRPYLHYRQRCRTPNHWLPSDLSRTFEDCVATESVGIRLDSVRFCRHPVWSGLSLW